MNSFWIEGIIFWEENVRNGGVMTRLNQDYVTYQTGMSDYFASGIICFPKNRKMPIGFATFDTEDETAFDRRDNFMLIKSTHVRGELPDLSVVANEALKFNIDLASSVDHFYKIKAPTFEGYLVDDDLYTMINGNLKIEIEFERFEYGEVEKTELPISILIEAATYKKEEENINE